MSDILQMLASLVIIGYNSWKWYTEYKDRQEKKKPLEPVQKDKQK